MSETMRWERPKRIKIKESIPRKRKKMRMKEGILKQRQLKENEESLTIKGVKKPLKNEFFKFKGGPRSYAIKEMQRDEG